MFYESWPQYHLRRVSSYSDTVFHQAAGDSLSPPVDCSVESCINWNRCTSVDNGFLKFCSVSTKLTALFTSSAHFVPTCSAEHGSCLRLIFTLEEANSCAEELRSTGALALPTCVLFLQDLGSLRELYSQSDPQSIFTPPFPVVSMVFPKFSYRQNIDFIHSLDFLQFYAPHDDSISPTVPLLPARREFLLSCFVARFSNTITLMKDPHDLAIVNILKLLSTSDSAFALSFKNLSITDNNHLDCLTGSLHELASDLPHLFGSDWIPCMAAKPVSSKSASFKLFVFFLFQHNTLTM